MRSNATEFSVTGQWSDAFDEARLQGWAEALRARLGGRRVSLGLVFMVPAWFPHARQVLEILQVHAQVPLLVGCSSGSLITDGLELEEDAGLVLGLYHLPGAELKAFHFTQAHVEEANGPAFWHLESGVTPEATQGWLVFLDPFHLDSERWLNGWNEAFPGLPVLGGCASGENTEQLAQVYLNGEVYEEGGVAVAVGGALRLAGVISQGCTPIGETWTITKAEQNLIQEIANRPAYQVLAETFVQLPPEQQKRAQHNLFIGLVGNEYQEEFHRGDFLVRNLLGGDPNSGVLAVGALPRPGQTVQFQCRDAAAATEDLKLLLEQAREKFRGATVYGGCLCSCNGRGHRFFGVPNHDAALVQQYLGPLGLTGFFCNGEIGPVGAKNFVHGYTASLALFMRK